MRSLLVAVILALGLLLPAGASAQIPAPPIDVPGVPALVERQPTKAVGPDRLTLAYRKAKAISAHRYPYRWGGGHLSFTGPYDCSGAVSAVLHAAGLLRRPEVSGQLARWGRRGKGRLTVYANVVHVFLVFRRPGHRAQHFGTGRWGSGYGGAGLKPQMHPARGFAVRTYSGI